MALNLHNIANQCIQVLSPNVELVVIRNTGIKNTAYGVPQVTYGDCELITAQKQTLNGDEQALVNNQLQNEYSRKFYLSTSGKPVIAGRRDLQEAPSYLYETLTGKYWRVFNVNEDYLNSGWEMVFACLQTTPPPEVQAALEASGLA